MYEIINSESVRRLEDNAVIPFNPENNDYVEYLQWLETQNEEANNP